MGVVFGQQIFDYLLPQRQIRLLFDDAFDFGLIRPLVGLGPRAVHRGALAAIEQAKLDARGVNRPPHQPAERVDLADDLPLADAADRRIAAHLSDGIAIGRDERRPRPEPRSRERRLGPGMPGTDHDHVELVIADSPYTRAYRVGERDETW